VIKAPKWRPLLVQAITSGNSRSPTASVLLLAAVCPNGIEGIRRAPNRFRSEMESKKRASRSGVFRLVLSPNRRAGSRARQAIRQRFSEKLPGATLGDLFSVVTELVNNSVQHGPGKPITVTLAMSEESIRGEVADQGNPAYAIPETKEVTETGGRGLAVIDKLTARWGVYEQSTHVWFEVPLEH
jgi:anti-sigma regulatory factor (Ser/Thr protein kinase)